MPKWSYQEIDYAAIDRERIRDNPFLFKLLAIASFIEITSNVYEENLSSFYRGDDALVQWLQQTWEVEEMQHGEALRRYVTWVWPEFDWEGAYTHFRERYLPLCNTAAFQPTRAREMLARMVVETGTSTYYQALARYAGDLNEPVLQQLAQNISRDEVHHFKAFNEAFSRYNAEEHNSKRDILKVLYTRLREANDEDIEIAHESCAQREAFDSFRKTVKGFAKDYYPYDMAVKMLMRPLALNQFIESSTAYTVQKALRVLGI